MRNPYQKQAKKYRQSKAATNDQGKMILTLYENAILFLSKAAMKARLGKVEECHNWLIKGRSIVMELQLTLNVAKGGEIAKNLRSLYQYIFDQLVEANKDKNPELIEQAVRHLKTVYEGWKFIVDGERSEAPGPEGQAANEKAGKFKVSV